MRYGFLLLLVCGLSGCTTMQMLGEAGEQIDKGNYGTGTFMGAASLLAGPIIDIFTLGGTLDTPEKAQRATDTATAVLVTAQPSSSSAQKAAQINQEWSRQQSREQAQAAMQRQNAQSAASNVGGINTLAEDSASYKVAVANSQGSSQTAVKKNDLHAPFMSSTCAQFSNWGSGITSDTKQVRNLCNKPIAVRHCFYEEGNPDRCKDDNVGWGVTNKIAVGGRALTVYPFKEEPGRQWKVKYRVCDMSDDSKLCLKPSDKKDVVENTRNPPSSNTTSAAPVEYRKSGYDYADTSVKPIVTPSLPAGYGRPTGREGIRRPGLR